MTMSASGHVDPIAVLDAGIDSYRPHLRDDGELTDPQFGVPTQYGTPYHAWGNAVLAAYGRRDRREDRIDAALRGLTASVAHVVDPASPPPWNGFDRATAAPFVNASHRDFFWPPILKTHALLHDLGADAAALDALWKQIQGVDVQATFRLRPPSNWAMVWCSGEWIRMVAGGSPHDPADMDGWLREFFDGRDGVGFRPELGFYAEHGLPNSYDLFTRFHLADLVVNGYDGALAGRVREFLTAGLRRSLAVQLSDGSLASAYRSTGQTWTVGAQIAYFRHCITLGLGTAAEREQAAEAADRALVNLAQWQRTGHDGSGTEFSPVQNRLPGWRRVGYEAYTADGHYANLAMGFLATAVASGYRASDIPSGAPADLDTRPASVLVEDEPLHRAVAHHGAVSVGVHAAPDPAYDGAGLVDVSFGSGRLLQLVSSVRHLSGGPWFNPGLAVRLLPGRTPTSVLSGLTHRPTRLEAIRGDDDAVGVALATVVEGGEDNPLAGWEYTMTVTLYGCRDHAGIDVVEATPGHPHHPTLFVPYPADLGDGLTTSVRFTDDGAVLELAGSDTPERLHVVVDAPITGAANLARDYENRRGACGVLRFDLDGPAESITWHLFR